MCLHLYLYLKVEPDCVRAVVYRIWKHWGQDPAFRGGRLGHICLASTAKLIQQPGVIKAQAGQTHNTVACFLIDFSCLMSITKGLKSLEKHVTRKEDIARWGFFVQKETSDLSRDNSNVRIETIWGAAFVYASKKDLPWDLFDYKVIPPHLPFGAFRQAHVWGLPLRQWAVMSAHRQLCDALELEGRNLAQLQSPEVQSPEAKAGPS